MTMQTSTRDAASSVAPAGDHRSALREMTADQLLHLGMRQVVYLRFGIRQGEPVYVLHGADGRPVARTDSIESAVQIAAEHHLDFVTVH